MTIIKIFHNSFTFVIIAQIIITQILITSFINPIMECVPTNKFNNMFSNDVLCVIPSLSFTIWFSVMWFHILNIVTKTFQVCFFPMSEIFVNSVLTFMLTTDQIG